MKTKAELNALKEEIEALNKKLAELTDEELKQVTGGLSPVLPSAISIGNQAFGNDVRNESLLKSTDGAVVYPRLGTQVRDE